MKKQIWIGLFSGLIAASAQAAPGEYWEISTKMEMAGMPFAMPAMTAKVCVPSGGEKNPQNMQKKDSNCQMTDVKTSGNKVTWKAKCIENGETMIGTGESTHEHDSYHGNMHMTGNSQGHPIDMTQTYSGKRIGGSCDAEAQMKEITGKICDTSQFSSGADWISRSDLFLKGNTCPGKKEALCSAVRKDAVRDVNTYQTLANMEKNNGRQISSACGIKMEATRVAVCKANKEGNYEFLKANCPAEAKEYKELARRKNCEGRGYTSRDKLNDCMSGVASGEDDEQVAQETSAKANKKKTSGNSDKPDSNDDSAKSGNTGNAAADSVLEGAKKLKGMFGF
jgi:hypothetical protein